MKQTTPLKSISEERAACVAAFEANPNSSFAWCCHHAILIEPLTEPFMARIEYIDTDKSKSEQAIRFRNFRPARVKLPEAIKKAGDDYNKALDACEKAKDARMKAWDAYMKALYNWSEASAVHDKDWPDNSWNGKSIFEQ
jgi:hypothetical protein